MLGKSPNQAQSDLFRPLLKDMIDPKHELVVLADKINWKAIEGELSAYYSHTGTPSKPVRLMAGLLILKQMYDLGDETVIAAWVTNPYMQYFCGEASFQWRQPCDPSDLVHFRKRIGKQGVERIFQASLTLFSDKIAKAKTVLVDTTVQEKNISFPTDVKLYTKVIKQCNKIARDNQVELRQSYTRTLKRLLIQVRFSHHPKRKKAARKAQRKIKTIAGRLVRELERNLSDTAKRPYQKKLALFHRVLVQTRHSKDKIYSLHEPHVSCIAKGKAHKPYEFGSKVGVVMIPGANIIVGIENFQGNPHDSTTLQPCLEHARLMTGKVFKKAVADRGYKGKSQIGQTEIVLPGDKRDSKLTPYQKNTKRKLCRQRSAIEPIIGHMKQDCRMARNYLKGKIGDEINAILAAAAFNYRQWVNQYRETLLGLLKYLFQYPLIDQTYDLTPSLLYSYSKIRCC